MSKKGRPALSEKDRLTKRSESIKKARLKRKELQIFRVQNGLCKTCGEPICSSSKVLCEIHLKQHRIYCRTYSKLSFSILKANAKRRKIAFCFTIESFNIWLSKQDDCCHYCGASRDLLEATGRKNCGLTIDRKDNQIGYLETNICLACSRCNTMKSDFFTYEQWMSIANEFIKPKLSDFHKGSK